MYERIVPRFGAACGAVFVAPVFGFLDRQRLRDLLVGELFGFCC